VTTCKGSWVNGVEIEACRLPYSFAPWVFNEILPKGSPVNVTGSLTEIALGLLSAGHIGLRALDRNGVFSLASQSQGWFLSPTSNYNRDEV
jgi:hypothetical protein